MPITTRESHQDLNESLEKSTPKCESLTRKAFCLPQKSENLLLQNLINTRVGAVFLEPNFILHQEAEGGCLDGY